MTFSAKVKTELCALPIGKGCCALAEAAGALLYANRFAVDEIRFITEFAVFAKRLELLFSKAFGLGFDEKKQSEKSGKFSLKIKSPQSIEKIATALGYDRQTHFAHYINFGLLEETCCMDAFLRGAFLSGGSVTDPEKNYHLELVTHHLSVARGILSLLHERDIFPKETTRRGNFVVYLKQSEGIEDFLTTIGATGGALEHMTTKVEKHMKSAIHRKVNCDLANGARSVNAALDQLAAIRKIEQRAGLESLPEKLYETALLRIVNPEANLAELAQLASPSVTKSCMGHRLKKIMELSKEGG